MTTKMISVSHIEYLKAGYNPASVVFPGTLAQIMGADSAKAETVFADAKKFADLIRHIENHLPSHVVALPEVVANPYSMAFLAATYAEIEGIVFSKGATGLGNSITLMERYYRFTPVDYPEKHFYFCISLRLVDVTAGTSSGASCKMFIHAGQQYDEAQGIINELIMEREWGNSRVKSGGATALISVAGNYRAIIKDNSICFIPPDAPVQGSGAQVKTYCYLDISTATEIQTRHNGLFTSPIYIGVGEYSAGSVVQDVVVGVHGDVGQHGQYSTAVTNLPGPYLSAGAYIPAKIASYGLVDSGLLVPKLCKDGSIIPIMVNGRPVIMPIARVLSDSSVIEIPDMCFYFETSPTLARTGVMQLVAGDELITGYRCIGSLCLSDNGPTGNRGCATLFLIMDEDYESYSYAIS